MKKTIAFILSVGLVAVLFAGLGCKPRDAKKYALTFAPPSDDCDVRETFNLTWGDCLYMEDDTYEASEGPFTDCGMSGRQYVYKVVVPQDGYITFNVYADDYIMISMRDNCNPNSDCFTTMIKGAAPSEDSEGNCYCMYGGDGSFSDCMYVWAGTYYIVVDTYDEGTYFNGEFCYGGDCYYSDDGDYYTF